MNSASANLACFTATSSVLKDRVEDFTVVIVRTAENLLDQLPLVVPSLFVLDEQRVFRLLPRLLRIKVPTCLTLIYNKASMSLEVVRGLFRAKQLISFHEPVGLFGRAVTRDIRRVHPCLMHSLWTIFHRRKLIAK